ncbi:phosphotransferase [Microlunatus soli]|uniref:Phosphotransferase enzyme family protein n=1 Tax=Microlunatus soli TaxID=630515 RepID=A0A1H1SRJ1_9ACTN|nr:phosphotransferase [Microlunatus soli]SDS50478.1 Phosphotransferase enzyme family protein [Microlunatus soli]
MYAASGRAILTAQWLAWAWIRLFGPRFFPGRSGRLDLPELREISGALGFGRHDLNAVATYRRRDVRGGQTFLATGSAGSFMIKIRQGGRSLELEQRLLAAAQEADISAFRTPRPIGVGRLGDGRSWSAQEMVFTAPHRPCLRLPDGFEQDLIKVLSRVDGLAATRDRTPAHGDLSPWNLRHDHRGQLWLFDWEDAELAPHGADRAYFEAAVGVIRPRREIRGVERSGAAYWAERITERLETGHPQGPNTIMLQRLNRCL